MRFECFIGVLWAGLGLTLQGQTTLTLTQALEIATGRSEQVDIARSNVRRAEAEQIRARAQRLPQLSGQLSYTRTLATEFSALFPDDSVAPECAPLNLRPDAPVNERVSEIERFLGCGGPSLVSFGNTNRLPFGRTNVWLAGLSFTQPVLSGGRIPAQKDLANAQREEADINLTSANAQSVLDITQAFYDAALARELLGIAEATLAEADQTLEFTRLGFDVGRLPEFDVLRAQVARNNQLPEVARRRAALDQSNLRLKQLLDLTAADVVRAEAELLSDTLAVPEPFAERFRIARSAGDVPARAPIRQADALVRQGEASLRIARSQRYPSLSVISDYSLVAYPQTFVPTARDQLRNNWTVGAALQVPLFQGGRIRADIESAAANLDVAIAQRQLTRELTALDTSVAASQLATAEETWNATSGSVAQATRAYEIARVRFRQGISSQLEVNDARLALGEARANRAQAARDLQVARATIALLPLLPLSNQQAIPGQPQLVQRNQPAATGTRPNANPFQTTNPFSLPSAQQSGSTLQNSPRAGSRRFP